MKRLIFLLLIALVPLEISAQSRLSDKGYVGDVSLSASFDSQIGAGVDLLTSHGYSFGNGLWLGGGTGVYMADKSDGMMLPIYTEARYSFLDININVRYNYIKMSDNIKITVSEDIKRAEAILKAREND